MRKDSLALDGVCVCVLGNLFIGGNIYKYLCLLPGFVMYPCIIHHKMSYGTFWGYTSRSKLERDYLIYTASLRMKTRPTLKYALPYLWGGFSSSRFWQDDNPQLLLEGLR